MAWPKGKSRAAYNAARTETTTKDDTTIATTTPADDLSEPALVDDHLALVALTPSEMPAQQQRLAEWCTRKIDSVQGELATFVALEDEAIAGGFKHASYHAGVLRTKKRITYYEKLKAAVEAGYLIVPNMPTVTFAVRVNRTTPPRKETAWESDSVRASAEILPAGEGRYVDDKNFTRSYKFTETDLQNKPIERVRYFASDFDADVDFPLQGVMPQVLQATAKAMALKLFDQLGVVQNSGGRDPIVVGQLLDPRGHNRCTTFFVAWWLNTASFVMLALAIVVMLALSIASSALSTWSAWKTRRMAVELDAAIAIESRALREGRRGGGYRRSRMTMNE